MAHHDLAPEIVILLSEIDAFRKTHGDMAESTFGRLAVNDWKLIRDLQSGRRMWPENMTKIRDFMSGYQPPAAATDNAEAA
jgi:hypothetical protein